MPRNPIIKLNEKDAQKAVEIAQIPAAKADRFCDLLSAFAMMAAFDFERAHGLSEGRIRRQKKFSKIEALASRLAAEVETLHEDDKGILGVCHYLSKNLPKSASPEQTQEQLRKMSRLDDREHSRFLNLYILLGYIKEVHAAAAMCKRRRQLLKGGGRPHIFLPIDRKLEAKTYAFDFLIASLVDLAQQCGGRLVAYKEESTGSLNALLDLLRPYLPEGLIPLAHEFNGEEKLEGQSRIGRLAQKTNSARKSG